MVTEDDLRKIIHSGEPKSITHNNKKIYINKKFIENVKDRESKEGGLLPLLPLLAALGGLAGGVGGLSAGIANTVKSAKESALIDEQRENIKSGKGIFLKPYEGKGLSDFFKSIIKNSNIEDESKKGLKNILKNLSDGISVEKQGDGLFLKPFKN